MRRPVCVFTLVFLVFLFFYLRFFPISDSIEVSDGDWISCTGTVCYKEYRDQQLILHLNHVELSQKDSYIELPTKQKIVCYMKDTLEPKSNAQIKVSGKAYNFLPANNPGEFDAARYYELQNVSFALKQCNIVACKKSYALYYEALYQLRRRLETVFDTHLSREDSAFYKALVLGNKHAMEKEQKELFQDAGISHIMAISGLHITILGMGLHTLLKKMRCNRYVQIVIPIVLMWLYGDLVGMSSSAKRAIIMFSMQMLAMLWGRRYDICTALCISCLLILAEQPLYLYHCGFLLSFSAVLGIMLFPKIIEENIREIPFKKINNNSYIFKSWIGNLSVFLAQFPIVLYFFYQYPWISFVMNMMIIPLVPFLFLSGMGLIPMSVIKLFLPVYKEILHLFVWLVEGACAILQEFPQTIWITGRPQTVGILLYAVILFLWSACGSKTGKNQLSIPWILKWCMLLLAVLTVTKQPQDGLYITYLSVGQGNSTWIKTQEGKHFLIDAGSVSDTKLTQNTLEPYLKFVGADRLEGVFLTHLDEDHISGITDLIRRRNIRIRKIYLAEHIARDEKLEEFMTLCAQYRIPIQFLPAGVQMRKGKETWTIWYPSEKKTTNERNLQSMVIGLEYGEFTALFPGDIDEKGEKEVAKILPEDFTCDVLLCAHHGSRNSNSLEFLQQIQPTHIIISCGRNNSYHHPHSEAVQRMEQVKSSVWMTMTQGAISIHCLPEHYEMKCYR